jgi:AI-2 transport protein TqsA
MTITLIALGFVLYFLKPVVVPLLLALFFTYCLLPAIDFQVRHLRIPRGIAMALTALFGVVMLFLLGLLVATVVSRMASDLGVYQLELNQLAERLSHLIPLEKLGFKSDPITGWFFEVPKESASYLVSAVFSEVTHLISNGVMVVIFMLFILTGRREETPADSLLGKIELQVRRYIHTMVLVAGTTGGLIAIVLAVLGVKFAIVFGFLAFLLAFIPNIGSIIAALLPMPLILLSPDMSIVAKVLAIACPAVIQFVMGNVVQPRLQGDSLKLHPIAVLMALIFFGMIWGIAGAFLATPVTAVLRIIFKRIPATELLARLLEGDFHASSGSGSAALQPLTMA